MQRGSRPQREDTQWTDRHCGTEWKRLLRALYNSREEADVEPISACLLGQGSKDAVVTFAGWCATGFRGAAVVGVAESYGGRLDLEDGQKIGLDFEDGHRRRVCL